MEKYVRGESSQVDSIQALENFCREETDVLAVATKTIHFLYELDVLSEDAIMSWFEADEDLTSFQKGFRAKVKPFIEWLQESEDDEDSDD